MSIARRLAVSFGATLLGPAVTILVQLINVPVMLHVWGPQLFGEWLVLSAVPSYLLLVDLGFGNVAGSDMMLRAEAGDQKGALETFQSSLLLASFSMIAITVLLAGGLFFLPIHSLLHISAMSPELARRTVLLLSVNCVVMLQWSVWMAAYRCIGRYAFGIASLNTFRIVEAAGFLFILLRRSTPAGLAAYMLCVSLCGTAWLLFWLRRSAPWLKIGVAHASRERIRSLIKPGFALLAFPICLAISTQGMTLTASMVIGPLAVAMFNPLRTVSRIPLQLTDALKMAFWVELSGAFGREDLTLARRLHRTVFQLSLLGAGTIVILLAVFGRRLFLLWTHGRVGYDPLTFHLLLLTAFAYSLWNASASVPMSTNRHGSISIFYMVVSAISLGLAALLGKLIGVAGIAAAMLFTDAAMDFMVIHHSNRLLSDPLPGFLRGCVDPRANMQLLQNALRWRLSAVSTDTQP